MKFWFFQHCLWPVDSKAGSWHRHRELQSGQCWETPDWAGGEQGRAGILHCAQLSLAPPWGSWKWGRCGSAHHIPVPGTGTEARFSSAVHLYKTHGKTAIARGIFITAVTGFEICKINEENPQIARICYHSYGYRSSQQEKKSIKCIAFHARKCKSWLKECKVQTIFECYGFYFTAKPKRVDVKKFIYKLIIKAPTSQ